MAQNIGFVLGDLATSNPFSRIDLLADHRSAAYFAMKDALIHYFSIRSKEYRRDFNLDVASAIDAFVALSKKDKAALHEAFTIGRRTNNVDIDQTSSGDWRKALLNKTKDARLFFSPDDLFDYNSLKIAYRNCCKIHHPDAGGTHSAMLSLNEAFNLLQEKISAATEMAENITISIVKMNLTPAATSTWCNWLGPLAWATHSCSFRVDRPVDADNALTILRTTIAIDEYELADSIERLKSILVLGTKIKGYHFKLVILEASVLLCTRLRAAALDADAIMIAQLVRNSSLPSTFPELAKKLNVIMQSDTRPQVNPLHPRQRANWERLRGKRTSGTANRLLTARKSREIEFIDAISALGGFLQLPPDPACPQIPLNTSRRVPAPNWETPLTPEQISEYHSVFYNTPSLDLVKKYIYKRLDLWFESLFMIDIPHVRLLTEIKTVAGFMANILRLTPPRQRIDSLLPRFTFIDFVDVLLKLSPDEIRHRLDLLGAIDARYGNSIRNYLLRKNLAGPYVEFPDIRRTFNLESPDQLSPGGHFTLNPLLVRRMTKEWFKAACVPIEHLDRTLETGWMTSREETVTTAWRRWRDYSSTKELADSLLWKTGAKRALEAKNDGYFATVAQEIIATCLAHMSKTEFVEELHLGWWSDNLAKVLQRLGDTAGAHRVAISFFELPPRAQAWTTEAEMDFLLRMRKQAIAR